MWEEWCKNNVLCVNILFALANFMTLTAKCIKLKVISIVSQVMLFMGCFEKSVTKKYIKRG